MTNRTIPIGPSDSSDSGSDLLGLSRSTIEGSEGDDLDADDTSDRNGTGELSTVGEDPDIRVANDIATDRVVTAEEAGLGGGLDQAEEAQLGITDEDLDGLRI